MQPFSFATTAQILCESGSATRLGELCRERGAQRVLIVTDPGITRLNMLDGVLPGFGQQRPNDWGLGFEIRNGKIPHWTAADNSPRTFGHFGQSGTFIWVDPAVDLALVVLTDRDFGDWTHQLWPQVSEAVLAEFSA